MEILFENYVTFIDGGTSDGVGFFVGNFFITAGHVFNEGQTKTLKRTRLRTSLTNNFKPTRMPVIH